MPNIAEMPDGSLLINGSLDVIKELESIFDDVGVETTIVESPKKNNITVAQMKQILSEFDDDFIVSLFVDGDEWGSWASVKVGKYDSADRFSSEKTILEGKMGE